jgi:hypothetical protein
MYMISTSYFARLAHITNPVSIANKTPYYYTGPTYPKLAPPWGIVHSYKYDNMSREAYTRCYHDMILDRLDRNQVVEELYALYPNVRQVTLLCYETPLQFCHRQLVASWLLAGGIEVRELVFTKPTVKRITPNEPKSA